MANYRKIYEQHYGVKIPKGFHIHHKDLNHKNDDPLNLEALHPDDHAQKHGFLNNFIMTSTRAARLGGEALAGKPKSVGTRLKMSAAKVGKCDGYLNNFYGKRHSVQTKLRIGALNSLSHNGSGNPNYGKIWITNTFENRMIPKQTIIPRGWVKGRTIV